MIRFLKNGSGIHIKESLKGSFTKYCKGKVTNECILKGKNSPDPKIRKKATFAANARKWKHQQGGQIFDASRLGIKTKELIDAINNRERNLAKDHAKQIFSGNEGIWDGIKHAARAAQHAYNGWLDPATIYLTGIAPSPSTLPGNPSSVANVVAREYLLFGGLKVIKSTDYLMKGIQGSFPKVNLSNILKKYNNEIVNNGILSEFKNTGRFKNLMNEILLEIEKVYGKLGSDAFNIIKTNPEGLPYKLGQKWELMYNFKKGGTIKKFADGDKIGFWKGFGNFLNSNVGLGLMNIGTNFLSTQALNKQMEGEAEALKALNEYNALEVISLLQRLSLLEANLIYQLWAQNYLLGLIQDLPSDIVAKHLGYKRYSLNLASQLLNLKNQNATIDALVRNLKAAQNADFWGSTLQQGLGMVGNYLSNKKGSTT